MMRPLARDILHAVKLALKDLPDLPHACDVTAAPGSGVRTIIVRDARGRVMLTVSSIAAVYTPAVPGREQRTIDDLIPRPELPVVPPLAVQSARVARSARVSGDTHIPPIAPPGRTLRVGDAVHPLEGDAWTVRAIEGDQVRLALDDEAGSDITVATRAITLDTADLWRFCGAARVWISESVWDALTPDDRDDIEHPLGGLTIDWQGCMGWVWARVARDEVLVTLRGVAEAHGVDMIESEIVPPAAKRQSRKPGVEKRAKKGGAK